jgi:3-ketosteroid 9alpha-monooxygenase subunit A
MKGWYLVAFERDLVTDLTPASIGHHTLVIVRQNGRFRAFDATCPHRGAHLAHGGRLCEDAIICPFHGHTIRLGNDEAELFSVTEHPTASMGGMVFVRPSPAHDNGWSGFLDNFVSHHFIINGFEMSVGAPMQTVIDNAFDMRHFQSVHRVGTDDFAVWTNDHGALIVESMMHVPSFEPNAAPGATSSVPYRAYVASPGLVAVELGGPTPYSVVTGATDMPTGGCMIRLSLAFPIAAWKTAPTGAVYGPLLEHSRRGLNSDRMIWEKLSTSIQPRWTPDDHASLRFLEFCKAHQDG